MCIKIIRSEDAQEFNPSEPLEDQVHGAEEILVSYDPSDSKIDSFVGQIERLCINGISCNVEIKVNANNYLSGIQLERKMDKLRKKLEVNEVVKGMCRFHAETDRKLSEMSEMCLEKIDER